MIPGFLPEGQVFLSSLKHFFFSMVLLTNQHDKHMNKLKLVIGIFAMGFFTISSCNNSENTETETEALPNPERSEEHTSELQSRENLVCRLLLEKKKKKRH